MVARKELAAFRRRLAIGVTVAALLAVARGGPAASVGQTAPTLPADAPAGATGAAPSTDPFPAGEPDPAAVPAGSPAAAGTSTSTSAAVSPLAASGIPSVALEAYQRAADAAPASCHIAWPLVAAIGRVESNHGRFAGADLRTDGRSTPPIVGIALDGVGTALIRDTDGGRLDGDTVYDRAVGPMQFIPSTWSSHGEDGDGDGRRDPFDIDDAAAATAAYLCTAGGDLSSVAGQTRAVLAYNHSDSYVATVLTLAATYAGTAPPVIPTTTEPPDPALPPANPGPPPAAAEDLPAAAGAPAPLPPAPVAPPTTPATTTPAPTTPAPVTPAPATPAPATPAPATPAPPATPPQTTPPPTTPPPTTPPPTTPPPTTPTTPPPPATPPPPPSAPATQSASTTAATTSQEAATPAAPQG